VEDISFVIFEDSQPEGSPPGGTDIVIECLYLRTNDNISVSWTEYYLDTGISRIGPGERNNQGDIRQNPAAVAEHLIRASWLSFSATDNHNGGRLSDYTKGF
jgi:hypothetical protein